MKNDKPKNKESLSPVSGPKKRIKSKVKGSTYERLITKVFREQFNYAFAKTSRQASRILDDSKVDISGIPYNVQTKSGYWDHRPKPDMIFKDMKEALGKNFPPHDPIHKYPKILFHKLDQREKENHLVTMMYDEWLEMFTVYEKYKDHGKSEIKDINI